jgi:phosphatidate cytidylyltransferase
MKGFFKHRAILFFWGIPLIVATVWFGGWWWTAFVSTISAVASIETMRLLLRGKTQVSELILVALLCALLPVAVTWQGLASMFWLFIAGLLAMGTLSLTRMPEDGFRLLLASTFTLMYVGLPFTAIMLIRHDPVWTSNFQGMAIVVYLYAGVWFTDTFAYLIGRKYGRRKLAPVLSPGKTLEGTFAGITMALLWTCLAGYALSDVLTWTDRIFLGGIIGVFAVIGDLVESMMKRVANVKDSGTIFFGHGGMLDRFDSLLFVQPAVYLYLIAADILTRPQLPTLF